MYISSNNYYNQDSLIFHKERHTASWNKNIALRKEAGQHHVRLLTLSTQWPMNDLQESHSVYNTLLGWQHLCSDAKVKHEALLISAHILYLKPEYFLRWVQGGIECSSRISDANFLIVFHSNDGSILPSFWDMTMGRTTDGSTNGLTLATIASKVGQQKHN